MKATLKTIVLIIVASSSLSFAFPQGAERTSRVAGVVVDVNEARVVGASIRIENSDVVKAVRSNDEGRFEVEVPAGTYQMTVTQNGFKKFYLPRFRVGAGTREVKIPLEVAPPKMPVKIN
jgi:hypothetical protein